jgi:hypothetical protein
MLLTLCFLDEQFVARLEFAWLSDKGEQRYLRPADIIASLDFRYYPKLLKDSFLPELVKKLKNAQKDNLADD